jgi:hypothetical protein
MKFIKMTTNDLRLGNYLGSNMGMVRVSEIQKDRLYINEGKYNLCRLIEEVKPISLDTQHLLDFGFIEEDQNEFYKNGFGIYKIGENLELSNHDFPIKLKFIHQLQNVFFALTGSELVFNT